jgi:hypothetical protein
MSLSNGLSRTRPLYRNRPSWPQTLLRLLFQRDFKQIGFLVAVAGIILIGIDLARNGGSLAAVLAVVGVLAAVGLVALWKGDKKSATSAEERADDQAQPGDRGDRA